MGASLSGKTHCAPPSLTLAPGLSGLSREMEYPHLCRSEHPCTRRYRFERLQRLDNGCPCRTSLVPRCLLLATTLGNPLHRHIYNCRSLFSRRHPPKALEPIRLARQLPSVKSYKDNTPHPLLRSEFTPLGKFGFTGPGPL